ncbi:MAG TPA: hemolysin-like protein [Rhodospirillaceae bacterium]|nr:hemolysin-like protein [Rhodospirillaceae bacterium]|tara:strand:+ start:921 stop:1748 length:828 start_codon:yes stop_codon:yes gene_type:complete
MDGTEFSTAFDPIEVGNLVARLAVNAAEIGAAQALRYRVFYEEMSAHPSAEVEAAKRDFDKFDEICDHLLVIDTKRTDLPGGVVGTYRLLRSSVANRNGGFYTSDEYEISRIVGTSGETLELGRSCVEAEYRNRPTMQLLWQSIAQYIFRYDIVVMFGCASMPGTDPQALALPLSYLYYYHLAPPALRPRALDERYVDMRLLPQEQIDQRRALAELPPLIKGYLRLGGFVGDGAVVDYDFNTTDVSIVVKTDLVTDKYFKHYERKSRRNGDEEEA